ncbi:LPS assembly protein LptD [Desulfovibrio mangrovi]|uniref:LPS-assembly protein LptD n=1 Tax=Desulfovibrio mangrovi TaxID=2976983 RepID=UPI002245A350|nr:LPS assembly protein LptD [Desulfovibrio mangrovi]UZP68817.1 LPS assembly protein LptD [Desulfovibrio mangrovi]
MAFCCALFLALALSFPVVAGATEVLVLNEDEEAVVWTLHADKLTSLNDSKVLEAEGKVSLRQGEDYLKADFIRYFSATNWVLLKGNVQVKMGEDVMESEEAEFDLGSRIGWLKNGKVFVDGPHIYLAGEKINKHWGDFYTFKNAKVTACDGDKPAWSVSAKEATIELDGYSQLWHTSFAIKDQDISYVPYFVLPMKTKRQTGFLFPEFGHSSKLGMWYHQAFYWAINESSDMTISEQWIEKRGFMTGLEYRHQFDLHNKGWWRVDALHDTDIDYSEDDERGGLNDDGLVRTNPERFWLRGMFDGTLADPRWKLKADLDYVSDQNYLREFKQSSAAFYPTRDALHDFFGRDLQEIDQNRTSEVQVSRDWERVGLAFGARYEQNVNLGNGNNVTSTDPTLQRLPQFDVFLFKGGLPVLGESFPIEFEAEGQAVNFFRHNGTRGSRFEIHPSVSAPLVSEYGTIIPKVGWRQTQYATESVHQYDTDRGDGKGTSRSVPDFSVAAFTELARNYDIKDGQGLTATAENVGESQWVALRHSVQPRMQYTNVPNVNQTDNPYYESHDRIWAENELRVSLVNLLSRKSESVAMADGEEGPAPVVNYDYRDVVRFRVEQAYDFREAERTDMLDQYERRPLSDTEAEVIVSPLDYLNVSSRSFWSPYENRITRHEHTVSLFADSIGRIRTGLDFRDRVDEYKRQRTEEESQSNERIRGFNTEVELTYFKPWSFRTLYRADIEKGTDLEKTVALIYTHQCFEFISEVSVMPDETSVNFYIKLQGLTF